MGFSSLWVPVLWSWISGKIGFRNLEVIRASVPSQTYLIPVAVGKACTASKSSERSANSCPLSMLMNCRCAVCSCCSRPPAGCRRAGWRWGRCRSRQTPALWWCAAFSTWAAQVCKLCFIRLAVLCPMIHLSLICKNFPQMGFFF